MNVHCYQCGVLTSILEHGELHVHFPDNMSTKPCLASWRKARCTTYPFDDLTPFAEPCSEGSDAAS